MARLRRAVRKFELSDADWPVIVGAGFSIEVDVPDGDDVTTVVLHVRGWSAACVAAIAAMSHALGCGALDDGEWLDLRPPSRRAGPPPATHVEEEEPFAVPSGLVAASRAADRGRLGEALRLAQSTRAEQPRSEVGWRVAASLVIVRCLVASDRRALALRHARTAAAEAIRHGRPAYARTLLDSCLELAVQRREDELAKATRRIAAELRVALDVAQR